jgi:amino acid transporter
MRAVLKNSLITACIATLCVLVLLFFVSTSHQWLLLVVIVEGALGFLVFCALLKRWMTKAASWELEGASGKTKAKIVLFAGVAVLILTLLIVASVMLLLRV